MWKFSGEQFVCAFNGFGGLLISPWEGGSNHCNRVQSYLRLDQPPLTGVLCHVLTDQGWFRKRIVTLLLVASIAEHLIKSLSLCLEITRGPLSSRDTSVCCRLSGSWRTRRGTRGGEASKRKVSLHSLMWVTIGHKASYIICDLHTDIEELEHVCHLCTDK